MDRPFYAIAQPFTLPLKSDMGMPSRTLRSITFLASKSTNALLDIILPSVETFLNQIFVFSLLMHRDSLHS